MIFTQKPLLRIFTLNHLTFNLNTLSWQEKDEELLKSFVLFS